MTRATAAAYEGDAPSMLGPMAGSMDPNEDTRPPSDIGISATNPPMPRCMRPQKESGFSTVTSPSSDAGGGTGASTTGAPSPELLCEQLEHAASIELATTKGRTTVERITAPL